MEEKLNQILSERFGTDLDQASRPQIYAALLRLTQTAMAEMPPLHRQAEALLRLGGISHRQAAIQQPDQPGAL